MGAHERGATLASLGFARPVYASAVAIYESNAYGTVRELLLLDEAGGYHALLDQSQGDIDSADCLHTPLVVSFPPTQRRITALWLRVGGDPSHNASVSTSHHQQGRAAQIDAAQLFSSPPVVGPGAPLRAFVATRGAARLVHGMIHMTSAQSGLSGALVVHMPSAFALTPRLQGGNISGNRTRYFRAGFEFKQREVDGAAFGAITSGDAPLDHLEGGLSVPGGLSFCYGEAPNAGSIAENGVASGLCILFRCAANMTTMVVEARYNGEPVRAQQPPPGPPSFAKVPVCDHAERIGQVFDPPQCEEPLRQLQPPLITSVATTRGQWNRVQVQVSASGLSVQFNGRAIFDRAPIIAWRPRGSWGFILGSRAGVIHPSADAWRLARLGCSARTTASQM